jgi:hypothetical protein
MDCPHTAVDYYRMRDDQRRSLGDEQSIDLFDAATITGIPYEVVVKAVTDRVLPTINSHPTPPGDWLVRRSDVLHWAALRPRKPRLSVVR